MYLKRKAPILIAALLALLLIMVPGCELFTGIRAETEPNKADPENFVEAVEPADNVEPYTIGELGLESLGLTSGMALEDVIAIMGEPIQTEKHDVMGPETTIYYDGISLAFNEGLHHFELKTPEIAGPRGIQVGDQVEKVFNSYPQMNNVPGKWKNPDAAFDPEINDLCVELYYFEPDSNEMVKSGISYYDEDTGDIFKVVYSHYVPFTCVYSGTTYYIEDGLVTTISRSGF